MCELYPIASSFTGEGIDAPIANLSILSTIPGHMMSDVVAILGSLDFVMGECDR